MNTKANAMKQAVLRTRVALGMPSSNRKIIPTRKLDELAGRIRTCVKCPLHQSRILAVPGEGRADAPFMLIGEAPGRHEDETGLPFCGRAGHYLDRVLEQTHLRRQDFFITNIVKCRPPANRLPAAGEIETCTSLYLFPQLELIKPRLIMLLGLTAIKALLGLDTVEEARGRIIEKEGHTFLATYHPAVSYRPDWAGRILEDFALFHRAMG